MLHHLIHVFATEFVPEDYVYFLNNDFKESDVTEFGKIAAQWIEKKIHSPLEREQAILLLYDSVSGNEELLHALQEEETIHWYFSEKTLSVIKKLLLATHKHLSQKQ